MGLGSGTLSEGRSESWIEVWSWERGLGSGGRSWVQGGGLGQGLDLWDLVCQSRLLWRVDPAKILDIGFEDWARV